MALPPKSLLPIGILALYFLHAFVLSFPMTAYGDWLFNIVHMPPATTSIYYAMAFFPWNLKPIYGLLSDNFPIFGYRRKYYVILCEIGTASAIFITGSMITTITGAFVVKFIDSACEAFAQIMLGIVLVDVASGDKQRSGNVQAWANAAKNSGSILATLIGIPVYKLHQLDPRTVICWTSCIPLIGIVICFALVKEKKVDKELLSASSNINGSFQSKLQQKCERMQETCRKIATSQAPFMPIMLFFFLCSALPSDSSVWYQYTFGLLSNEKECLQYTSLAGTVGSVLSCLVYAKLCSGKSVRLVFLVSTVLSIIAGLPKLLLTPPVANLPVSVCTFCTFEAFVTSFTGEFALLQLLVVATFCCAKEKKLHGLTYSLYLSFMDFGGVASAFLSSSLISALGITADPVTFQVNWSNLWILTVLSTVFRIAVLLFLCLLPRHLDASENENTEKDPLLPVRESD